MSKPCNNETAFLTALRGLTPCVKASGNLYSKEGRLILRLQVDEGDNDRAMYLHYPSYVNENGSPCRQVLVSRYVYELLEGSVEQDFGFGGGSWEGQPPSPPDESEVG